MKNAADDTYRLRRVFVGSVSLLELYGEGAEDGYELPLLLLFHGLGSIKERKLQHAYIAASEGFFVVLPDCARHGERQDEEFAALTEVEAGTHLLRLTRDTADDCAELLQAYRRDDRVSSAAATLMGTSMGGMIVYDYLRRYGTDGIACAVPIISSPAWKEMTDHIRKNNPDYDALFTPELQQEVEASDPRQELLELRDLPLLMLNAEDDELMPIDSVRRFYHELSSRYDSTERIVLQSYPNHGHMTSETMMYASVDWAKRHLSLSNR